MKNTAAAALLFLLTTTVPAPAPKAPAGAHAPRYAVIDLGITIGTFTDGPRAINKAGDIVGTMHKDGTDCAFLWRRGKLTPLRARGWKSSQGIAINNHGQAVVVATRANGWMAPSLWQGEEPTEITSPDKRYPSVQVCGINDGGQVLGYATSASGSWGFLWYAGQGGGAHDSDVVAIRDITPCAANNRGQVTGDLAARESSRAVIWDNGQTIFLGTLPGGGVAFPRCINNRGFVAGEAYMRGFAVGAAPNQRVLTEHAFLWDGTTMLDLGELVCEQSEANAINDRGQVVGSACMKYEKARGLDHTTGRATLWQDGKAYDLNNCVPGDSGWVLERAYAINESGQIVGTGYRRDGPGKTDRRTERGFVLTPRGEPT